MIINSTIYTDQVPGEPYLLNFLQKQVNFVVGEKTIKKGRLILFRRSHYFIEITFLTEKGTREHIDVPIPFKIEYYKNDKLLYFDYRLSSLQINSVPNIPSKVPSIFFNRILEITNI